MRNRAVVEGHVLLDQFKLVYLVHPRAHLHRGRILLPVPLAVKCLRADTLYLQSCFFGKNVNIRGIRNLVRFSVARPQGQRQRVRTGTGCLWRLYRNLAPEIVLYSRLLAGPGCYPGIGYERDLVFQLILGSVVNSNVELSRGLVAGRDFYF